LILSIGVAALLGFSFRLAWTARSLRDFR
jgi:hypothetical protein